MLELLRGMSTAPSAMLLAPVMFPPTEEGYINQASRAGQGWAQQQGGRLVPAVLRCIGRTNVRTHVVRWWQRAGNPGGRTRCRVHVRASAVAAPPTRPILCLPRTLLLPRNLPATSLQVRWYSFQFVMDEMVNEIEEAFWACSAVLRQLPYPIGN